MTRELAEIYYQDICRHGIKPCLALSDMNYDGYEEGIPYSWGFNGSREMQIYDYTYNISGVCLDG